MSEKDVLEQTTVELEQLNKLAPGVAHDPGDNTIFSYVTQLG